ncbi:MAG: phage tail tape measure protein [Rhizobiaceae bacterium]|nr:phage tail tape measure protein [Rhizobiaceae bacterium]
MSRLSASLVVDLVDKTGAKTQTIIGNMNRLKRAERDYMLADRGLRLSNRDRAMERLMMEQEAAAEARRQRITMLASRVGTAVALGGVVAAKAYTNFADLERRVNRIVINADKGASAIEPTIKTLQGIAEATRTSFDDVVGGLEALVASGRSLDESLSFLPAVAVTAQASGAAMNDVALSADALAGNLKINAEEMQRAFDILVAGGKAGKFELKDMAQYLPSLLPAFSAMGYKGTEGLQKIVAMLQVMRNQAGSSSEAATYLGNVLNKVYSEETAKKFKDMGVDLPRALEKAKKEGKDVLDVFLDMTTIATKGDLSKLPKLFTDAEFQKGVRALITQRPEFEELVKSLASVDGTALKDFNQIAEDSASKIQKMTNLWDQLMTRLGSGVASVANPALESLTQTIDEAEARAIALKGMDGEQRAWQRGDFFRDYRKLFPGASSREVNLAYNDALVKVGRGTAASPFDGLKAEAGRRAGGALTGRYPSRGSYGPGFVPEGLGADPATGAIPVPFGRPGPAPAGDRSITGRYPSRGVYDPAAVAAAKESAPDPALDGFLKFHGLVEAGADASDKIAEGGGRAGEKAAQTMQASAGPIGTAIAQSFLAKVQGSLGAILANAGGGRPTGQVVKEQINGQFVDP